MWEPRLDDESMPTVARSSRTPSLVNATASTSRADEGDGLLGDVFGQSFGVVVASTRAAPARSTSSSVSPRGRAALLHA